LLTVYVPDAGTPTAFAASSSWQLDVTLAADTFEVVHRFSPFGAILLISNPQGIPHPPGSILDRLSSAITGSTPSSSAPKAGDLPSPGQGSGPFDSFFSGIGLWYICLQRSTEKTTLPDGTVGETPGSVYWRVNLIADWTTRSDVLLGLEFDSNLDSLYGKLLFSNDASPLYANRRFDYDWQLDVSTAVRTPLPLYLDIWQLFSPNAKAPPQIPSKIIHGSVGFRKATGNDFTFNLSATIVSEASFSPPPKNARSAPDGFSWDVVSVDAMIQSGASGSLVTLGLFTEFTLTPPSGSSFSPATFDIDIQWSSAGSWVLHGSVGDLPLAMLADFFDGSVRDIVAALVGPLPLGELDVVYTYDADGEASSFLIHGVIFLGALELDLAYEYASGLLEAGVDSASVIVWKQNGTEASHPPPLLGPVVGGVRQSVWTFTATLGSSSPGSTIGSMLQSVTGNAVHLPAFVASIPVGEASGPQSAVKLVLRGTDAYMALSIAITIGDFTLTFISLSTPSSTHAKRILRVQVDQIPLVKDIPLIKQLPQPFDKLVYLWLDDDSGRGVLQTELAHINDELDFLSIPRVVTKDTNNADPTLPVLRPGHHFMVLNKGGVVLDHVFGDDAANSDGANAPANGTAPSDGPTKGGLQIQLPFLTISGIALDFRGGSIVLDFDAAVKLGPLFFALVGFYIGIPLSSIKLNDLSHIEVDFGLHGLEVALDQPPVTLAGVFIHDGIINLGGIHLDSYRGGISLGFQAWKFIAVGQYGKDTDSDFKTVFIYASLDGPLVTLAFASITGVRVGLGFNSMIRSPTVKELPEFPLLDNSAASTSGQSPLALLNKFLAPSTGIPWVSPKEDAYWVAAGLTLTAFGILSVTAVLVFGVRDGGFVISVFANGIARMPPAAPPEATLFYVEIGMLAEINTVDGYFTVQAALAPSSHVLVPSCRLTGGFALVNWFSPSPHSGDFVFTVGGVCVFCSFSRFGSPEQSH
jgi:hypothetical protein